MSIDLTGGLAPGRSRSRTAPARGVERFQCPRAVGRTPVTGRHPSQTSIRPRVIETTRPVMPSARGDTSRVTTSAMCSGASASPSPSNNGVSCSSSVMRVAASGAITLHRTRQGAAPPRARSSSRRPRLRRRVVHVRRSRTQPVHRRREDDGASTGAPFTLRPQHASARRRTRRGEQPFRWILVTRSKSSSDMLKLIRGARSQRC